MVNIAAKGGQQVLQQRQWQLILVDRRLQRLHDAVPGGSSRVGRAAVSQQQRFTIAIQFQQALRGSLRALVGDIVSGTCKVVERRHGGPDGARAQPAGHRKVLVVGHGPGLNGGGSHGIGVLCEFWC